MDRDIDHILVSEEQVQDAVVRTANWINEAYKDKEGRLLLLGILKGSVVFMGDLMKHIKLPIEIDFMKVSSYGSSTTTKGNVNIILDLVRKDIDNINIVIVEDIIDSGVTLSYLVEYLKRKGAKSVATCTLLDKPSRRKVDFTPDFTGIEVPDEFVVGYGLDYDEFYRTLPYIGVLKEEIYKD
ncbi:MAG: hypoxanthine phosphoribosyltransferase [Ruminococcaceae bacterium]|nr:hypoxanthine phosphoribosyltransferase [Oscillospiraceae bacterium]